MKTKIVIYLVVLGFMGINKSQSQDYQHFTSWNRLMFIKPLSPKIDLWVEGFYRQQNNFHYNKNNPFYSPLMRGGRVFLFYKIKNYTLGLSPIMYLKSFQLLGKKSDFEINTNQEYRFNAFVENSQNFGKLNLRARLSYELRYLQSLDYSPIGRFRPRLFFKYPLSKNTFINGFEDIMLNTWPNQPSPVFNINQLYLGVNQKLNTHLALELGIFNNFRQRRSIVEFDNENAISLLLQVKL